MNKNFLILFFSIILGCLAILIFLIFIFKKSRKLRKLNKKRNKVQLSELIENKFFVTSDSYRLKFYSNTIKNNNKNIYFFVHDLFGLENKTKNNLFLSKYSIISFKQRGYEDENFLNKSLSNTVMDAKEIIEYLRNNYKDKKIILIAEGFAINIAIHLEEYVDSIFLINPILTNKDIGLNLFYKISLYLPLIKKLNSLIFFKKEYSLLTSYKSDKKINDLYLNYLNYYQTFRFLKKNKISNNDKYYVFQSNKSFFYNKKKFDKKIKINNNNINMIDSNVHLLSTTTNTMKEIIEKNEKKEENDDQK